MYQCGGSLQRLYQIWFQRILQKRCHSSLRFQIRCRHRLAGIGIADDDPSQSLLEVGDIGGKAQDRHDLAGHGDVKTILTRHTVGLTAQAVNDVTQLTVVHIHAASPDDALGINPEAVSLLNVIVQHSGKQIVCRADGMKIAGKMEIDILHGNDLRVAAAGSAAFQAENRTEARLTQGSHCVFPQFTKRVRQADRGRGFPLSGRRGIDSRDKDQFSVLSIGRQQFWIDLCLIAAVWLQGFIGDPCFFSDLPNRLQLTALGNFNITQISHGLLLSQRGAQCHIVIASFNDAGRGNHRKSRLLLEFRNRDRADVAHGRLYLIEALCHVVLE